jgi:hypothetical protein
MSIKVDLQNIIDQLGYLPINGKIIAKKVFDDGKVTCYMVKEQVFGKLSDAVSYCNKGNFPLTLDLRGAREAAAATAKATGQIIKNGVVLAGMSLSRTADRLVGFGKK